MKLELGFIEIKDIQFSKESKLENGILFVNADEAKNFVFGDDDVKACVKDAHFDIAKPGESVRITPVKDVIEPRVKVEGPGGEFPGVIAKVDTVGSGKTHVLRGMAVVTAGKIVGFQEGVIDMTGPGADYTAFSKLLNLVLVCEPVAGVHQHEYEHAVRIAGLRAATYIGELGRNVTPDSTKEYETLGIKEGMQKWPDLPRVAYVHMLQSQGLLHDTYVYGVDAKKSLTTIINPTETMDGAIISGNCVSPGSKTTTYHHLNNAVIKALWAKHGKELNFVGIILNPLMVTLKEKQRDIMMSVRIATEEFGADAAIISQEGFGNPTTDLMHVCRGLEKRGVKTVIITNEDAGTDGMSESLPDVVTEANAIVSTGNSNATILLPKMDRVLGELKEVERVTGGNVDSIKPDGTLLLEIHGIMGGHNLQGNTYLSATTV